MRALMSCSSWVDIIEIAVYACIERKLLDDDDDDDEYLYHHSALQGVQLNLYYKFNLAE